MSNNEELSKDEVINESKEVEFEDIDESENDSIKDDYTHLVEDKKDELSKEDKMRFTFKADTANKIKSKEFKDSIKKEEKIIKRKTFFKRLKDNLLLEDRTLLKNSMIRFTYAMDFLINVYSTLAIVAGILLAILYLNSGNWIMALASIVVAFVINLINK